MTHVCSTFYDSTQNSLMFHIHVADKNTNTKVRLAILIHHILPLSKQGGDDTNSITLTTIQSPGWREVAHHHSNAKRLLVPQSANYLGISGLR